MFLFVFFLVPSAWSLAFSGLLAFFSFLAMALMFSKQSLSVGVFIRTVVGYRL